MTLPDGTLSVLAKNFDAILAGAFGDPRAPDNRHAEDILLGMRRGIDRYINLRPVRLLDDSLTPLKSRTTSDINFISFARIRRAHTAARTTSCAVELRTRLQRKRS